MNKIHARLFVLAFCIGTQMQYVEVLHEIFFITANTVVVEGAAGYDVCYGPGSGCADRNLNPDASCEGYLSYRDRNTMLTQCRNPVFKMNCRKTCRKRFLECKLPGTAIDCLLSEFINNFNIVSGWWDANMRTGFESLGKFAPSGFLQVEKFYPEVEQPYRRLACPLSPPPTVCMCMH